MFPLGKNFSSNPLGKFGDIYTKLKSENLDSRLCFKTHQISDLQLFFLPFFFFLKSFNDKPPFPYLQTGN